MARDRLTLPEWLENPGGATRDASPDGSRPPAEPGHQGEAVTLVTNGARLFRIQATVEELENEIHDGTVLDDSGARHRLALLDGALTEEVDEILAGPLREEFRRLAAVVLAPEPTVGELRVAVAQLKGWVEGLLGALSVSALVEPPAPPDG